MNDTVYLQLSSNSDIASGDDGIMDAWEHMQYGNTFLGDGGGDYSTSMKDDGGFSGTFLSS